MLRDGYAKQQNEEFMTSSFKGNMKTSEDPKHLLSDAKYGTVKKKAKNKKTKKKHNVKAQFQIGGKKEKGPPHTEQRAASSTHTGCSEEGALYEPNIQHRLISRSSAVYDYP